MAGGRGMSMSSEAATSAPRTPPLLDFRMGMSGSASFQKQVTAAVPSGATGRRSEDRSEDCRVRDQP